MFIGENEIVCWEWDLCFECVRELNGCSCRSTGYDGRNKFFGLLYMEDVEEHSLLHKYFKKFLASDFTGMLL